MAAIKAAQMGLKMLQNEKPRSSITAFLDVLCIEKYEEDDYEGIPEMVEAINLQYTGPAEAARAIRKKLKYSNVHGQLRALTILKALTENGGPKFQAALKDSSNGLIDRLKLMAGDPHTDDRVKKKIMSVLGSWYRQFKDDPTMQSVAGVYASCGGGKKTVSRTAATEAYERQQAKYEQEARERAERKALERSNKEKEKARLAQEKEDRAKAKRNPQQARVKRPPFNFEKEKPQILTSVAAGTQSAQALINALQHVNREKESVFDNERVQTCLAKVKNDRKAVVRYIRLVDMDAEGDFIGTLIATNEQILASLALYDRMSKPVELDSDDEHIQQIKQQATQSGLHVPPGADDDTTSIRSRLSAFDMQDREVDKLQNKQRSRVEAANRARAQPVHPDLQDLAFGPTAGSSTLPPPIEPRNPGDDYTHGSLSDYSDYSSSDGEEYHGAPPTSASSSSATNAYPQTSARSYAQYIQQDDERTGKGKGLLEEPDEDDPFADPDDGASLYSVATPGIQDKRMEWKEV
ncbi:hypothetical protein BCR35DRAFT_308360 [Leucosporidium creatinivorum]|uniref:VHS domain-containing protein n=1 Tax=Leucosporidium creatinivorum TaxID=106004 RepID=A0A1Y2E7T6_9BASI|nr:hypothetical protein BCR35DRAFT_308360 [Leucosporidium creatinivorum]